MFEIDRQPLKTEVHCRECRATIEINTDSRRQADRSISEFQKQHRCRPIGTKEN